MTSRINYRWLKYEQKNYAFSYLNLVTEIMHDKHTTNRRQFPWDFSSRAWTTERMPSRWRRSEVDCEMDSQMLSADRRYSCCVLVPPSPHQSRLVLNSADNSSTDVVCRSMSPLVSRRTLPDNSSGFNCASSRAAEIADVRCKSSDRRDANRSRRLSRLIWEFDT